MRNKKVFLICLTLTLLVISIKFLNADKAVETLIVNSKVFINASVLNLREQPSLSSKKIGCLMFGDDVVIIAISDKIDVIDNKKDRWYKIKKDGNNGWAFGAYLISEKYKFIGTYQYKDVNNEENHYIKIYVNDNKYSAIYIGCDSFEDHGVYYYKVDVSDLKITDDGNIIFSIGYRTEFPKSLTFESEEKDCKECGFSKAKLKYKGKIYNNKISFDCLSDSDDCWKEKFIFEKSIK